MTRYPTKPGPTDEAIAKAKERAKAAQTTSIWHAALAVVLLLVALVVVGIVFAAAVNFVFGTNFTGQQGFVGFLLLIFVGSYLKD